jgi:dUTP pyrophosphatase
MFTCNQCPKVQFVRTHEDAVIPTKGDSLAVCYDLTVIGIWKVDGQTTFYETGIIVKPPNGYYTEVHPRSSISKTGYMLANSVGIIDPNYRGTLKVALRKVDQDKPDLELPCKIAQLKLEHCIYYDMEEVKELDSTERGDGAFGSTG